MTLLKSSMLPEKEFHCENFNCFLFSQSELKQLACFSLFLIKGRPKCLIGSLLIETSKVVHNSSLSGYGLLKYNLVFPCLNVALEFDAKLVRVFSYIGTCLNTKYFSNKVFKY